MLGHIEEEKAKERAGNRRGAKLNGLNSSTVSSDALTRGCDGGKKNPQKTAKAEAAVIRCHRDVEGLNPDLQISQRSRADRGG